MKQCISCGDIKPSEEFHNRTKAKDGKQPNCKDCNREQRKAYYKTAHGKEKNTVTGKRWRQQVQYKVFLYLQDHPCIDCGEDNPVVLEFDHREPSQKKFSICEGVRSSFGWSRILEEIMKCDVRCANCHRKKTASQFGHYRLAWMTQDVIE